MTNPETIGRKSVEYFVQCQQPDGVWEQCSSPNAELYLAAEDRAAARRMMPGSVFRVVRLEPVLPAAVPVPPSATRADVEAIARVRAIHVPDENGNCRDCQASFDPCPTIVAIDGDRTSFGPGEGVYGRDPFYEADVPGPCVAGEQQNETPEAVSRPTRYEVNLVPETDDPGGIYAITVEYRGDNRWAVLRHSLCLSLDGQWDRERNSSEREEEWLDAHRFDLDTALRLAEEQAVDIAPAKWSGRDRKPQHVGGRVNAEDCPACHGTNPPYPFICPGPSAP